MERYNKIKSIGSGTFGQAWLVESVTSQRRYALKELGVNAMSEQDRHLALNEANILSKLKHKNIVRYKEAFVAQGKLCIAMEFAENGDLYTRIRERNGLYFSEMQILGWFTQLCLALKYLHGQNILHRDLKTQNIFLGKDDIIKIGDFGIARMLNNTLDHAQTTVGTPYYLSPEICQRKPYNHKSDMWSLGCVLYEMATLKHAFNANNFSALVIKILQEQYPPVPSSYGPLVEDLVWVLLQKNPDDRPSAKQLLYVPSMQPYVKRFLMSERERTESLASDIADVSSTSSRHDCSQMSGAEKEENIKNAGRMVVPVADKSSPSKDVGGSVSKDVNSRQRRPLLDYATKPHDQTNVTVMYEKTAVKENPREIQGHFQAYNSTPNDRENLTTPRDIPQKKEASCSFQHDHTSKPRENCPRSSDTIVKAGENLRIRCSQGTRKQSLIALAHAQRRRYSEQTSTCSEPGARVHKSRIHSQGYREFVDAEDEVFTKNQATVIHVRTARNRNVGTIRTQVIDKHVSSSCKSNVTTNPEQRKQKPVFSVSQAKRSEDVHKSKRHHSDVSDRSLHPVEQKHQGYPYRLDHSVQDKENVSQEISSSSHVQEKRPISSKVFKEIQASNVKQQMAKSSSEEIEDKVEYRKRTYTISNYPRPSEFEIPEVFGKEHTRSDKKESEICKDANLSVGQSAKGRKYEIIAKANLKNQTLGAANQSRTHGQTPSCKFIFSGKTLHLDNVTDHDSVYSHMEALRMHLEEKLGTRRLTAVYRYVTNVPLEEHERVKQTVLCMLGEEYMTYFPVLLQLVACEALYFH